MKYQDAQFVSDEALTYYDREILRVLRYGLVADQFVPFKTIARGKQNVSYWTPVALSDPNLSLYFLESNEDRLARAKTTKEMLGIHKDIYIPMVELDGSSDDIEGAEAGNLAEATSLVAEFVEKVIYRGSDIYFSKSAETKPTVLDALGLFNATGCNNIAAGGSGIGADDDMQAIGDFIHTINHMISAERQYGHYGPYALVMTPGLATQTTTNTNATTGETELDLIRRTYTAANMNMAGWIKGIYVTPHLVGAALATTTQEMMLVEPSPSNFYLAQTYPLERGKPWNDKNEGLFFKLRWKGIIVPKRPRAICTTTTLITGSAY